MHWFSNDDFSDAVEKYLSEEKLIIEDQFTEILQEGPFKQELNL
jgi:predicted N-acyltransferase